MAHSLSEIIAEARENIKRRAGNPGPPRETTVFEAIEEARANIRRQTEGLSRVTPRFRPQADDEIPVTRIIDGDTIELDGIGPVRLTGFNAPETVHPEKGVELRGPESSQLASAMFLGKKVRFTPQAGDEQDVYGRILGTVTLPDGRIANAELASALGRYGQPPSVSAATIRDARAAAGTALRAGVLRGLLYPVGSLVPELYESLGEEIARAKETLHQFMQEPQVFQAMGRPSDTLQNVITGTPSVLGEIAGGFAPGLGLYKVAQSTFRVAKTLSLAERTTRHMAASTAAGAGFGAAAHLEDGESRWARVARDAAIAGAGELVFLPLMKRAWKAELGAAADRAARELALKTGISLTEAERKITAVRSGALGGDFETAKEVADLSKTIPELTGSPVHVQAVKALGLLDRVLPEGPATVDPHLPKEIALSFDLEIAGGRLPVRLASRAEATPDKILEHIDGVVSTIAREMSVGRPVKILNPMTRDPRSWEFFKNRLLSRGIKKTPAGPPPGAAPKGSVAESGSVPEVGTSVNVIEPTGQRVKATVIETPEPLGEEDFLSFDTSMPATRGRLLDAGFTGEEIRSLPELDLHVAAVLATPGKQGRQSRVTREFRERSRQGTWLQAPENMSDYTGFTAKEAAANGLDFRDYVTALTQHVLRGEELSSYQARSFPYLAQLSRRVKELSGEPIDVPVELGRVRLPVTDPESQEIVGIREAVRRTIPEEGEVFHVEGGVEKTPLSKVRAAKRAAIQKDVARLTSDIQKEADPGRRAQLEGFLRNAQRDLQGVAEPRELPPPRGRVKKVPPDHIVVRGPSGKEELRHVASVFVEVPTQGQRLGVKQFVAHPDGGDRHGLIHLDKGEISLEAIGGNASPGDSYFRSSLFTSVDPQKDFGRDIPFFIHPDGSATVSITPVNTVIKEKQASFGHRFEWGPPDTVSARRDKPPMAGKVTRRGEEVIGLVGQEPPAFGRFGTTYVPRAVRGPVEVETRYRPSGAAPGTPEEALTHGFYLQESGSLLRYGDDFEEAALEEGAEATVRGARKTGRRGPAPLAYSEIRGMRVQTGYPVRRKPGEGPLEYSLTRESLTGADPHPEWATVRSIARLMTKQGYDPQTPLRIRIAREVHRGTPDAPATMTIKEAAALELPLPNSDKLFEEASVRGIKVLPKGAGSEILFPDGSKRVFPDDLEALEAVMRVPVSTLDRPLEGNLQRSWNMGAENGVDPDIDSRAFLPAKLQELVLGQIVKGGRPFVEVKTSNLDEFNSAFEVLTRGRKEKIQVQTLEEVPGGITRLAVFDRDLVMARLKQNTPALQRLGINPEKDPRLVVQDLDRLPHGVDILQSEDPDSAIMYSWFRQHSMKGNWEQGEVLLDTTGPHRIFTDEQKLRFGFRICP